MKGDFSDYAIGGPCPLFYRTSESSALYVYGVEHGLQQITHFEAGEALCSNIFRGNLPFIAKGKGDRAGAKSAQRRRSLAIRQSVEGTDLIGM